jgi:FdhD protein
MATMQESTEELEAKGITPDLPCDIYSEDGWVRTKTNLPSELEITVYVNGKEMVKMLCTPAKLNCLILGFLYEEGVISDLSDVTSMRICEDDALADVKLKNTDFIMPELKTLTSGCMGGVAFNTLGHKVESDIVVSPEKVLSLMKRFQNHMELYKMSGGIHTSALADLDNILVLSEDIGRHNTFNKIMGECLLRKLSTQDGILMSTGRISSEMLLKASVMQVPIVISRTSPTARAVAIANELGITVIGYARAGHMKVYSHPERLGRPRQ